MRRCVFVLCASALLGNTIGCNSAPDGMPVLYPCKVTILDGGDPAGAEIIVALQSDPPTANAVIFGQTDPSGIAEINTRFKNFEGAGAPEGTYKITLKKGIDVPHTKTADERKRMSPPEQNAYEAERDAARAKIQNIVPESLGSVDTSELVIEVTREGGECTVDLADQR